MNDKAATYLFRTFHLISSSRRLLSIIWPFLLIVPMLLMLSLVSMDILSSVRAYVGGEGLYSKAQKDAIFYLERYTESRAESDYQVYLQTIAVPLGDAIARRELEKTDPDLEVARRGFLQGRNQPVDIDGMIRLFRDFRHVSYIDRIIDIWRRGDLLIEQLCNAADELHRQIRSGASYDEVRPILDRIRRINLELTPMEDDFSFTLGEASRTTKLLLLNGIIGIAVLLVLASTVLSRRMLSRNDALQRAQQLGRLNEALEHRVQERTGELEASNQRLAREIEARKRAEERFRRVIEFAPNAMLMINRAGIIEMANARMEEIFQYPRAALLGHAVEMLVPERLRAHHPALREGFVAAPGSLFMGEGRDLYGVRRDGSEVPIEIALNPVETEEGLKVLAAVMDVSDRRQKEERIRAALKEKVILLGEIHHRVKNNLQIIHSLLDLQMSQIDDDTVRDMLQDSKNRIRSMALIHQTLYQSKNFSQVDLGQVLRALASDIAASQGLEQRPLRVVVEAESVLLAMNAAIPCGLIANELITNALKHGFPDGRSGCVTVSLSRDAAGRVNLEVSDDGVGLRAEVDPANVSTLGLELVALLADQLFGELAVQRSGPTRFAVNFPLEHE